MNYLFFDIECSNCYGKVGKICEFGYVLTNSDFKIIKKDDIPICPGHDKQSRFDKKIKERDPKFNFAYDEDYYLSRNEFPSFYAEIKSLLENKQNVLFGYSAAGDMRFLLGDSYRYNLDKMNFSVYDVQKMLDFTDNGVKVSHKLEDVFISYYGKGATINLQPHLSRDDAYMTMGILKRRLENLGIKLDELINKYPASLIKSEEYDERGMSQKKNNKTIDFTVSQSEKSVCRKIWDDYVTSKKESTPSLNINGKKYVPSLSLMVHRNCLEVLIHFIDLNRLIPVRKIDESDFLVAYNEIDKTYLEKSFRRPYLGKVILYKELISLCNSNPEK